MTNGSVVRDFPVTVQAMLHLKSMFSGLSIPPKTAAIDPRANLTHAARGNLSFRSADGTFGPRDQETVKFSDHFRVYFFTDQGRISAVKQEAGGKPSYRQLHYFFSLESGLTESKRPIAPNRSDHLISQKIPRQPDIQFVLRI